jgi:hypothetical protein
MLYAEYEFRERTYYVEYHISDSDISIEINGISYLNEDGVMALSYDDDIHDMIRLHLEEMHNPNDFRYFVT